MREATLAGYGVTKSQKNQRMLSIQIECLTSAFLCKNVHIYIYVYSMATPIVQSLIIKWEYFTDMKEVVRRFGDG